VRQARYQSRDSNMMNRYKLLERTLCLSAAACVLAAVAHGAPPTASTVPRVLDLTPMLRALGANPQVAPAASASKKSAIVLPEGEGMELTKKLCSGCHGTDVFARQRHDRAHWNQVIDNMMSKGMDASDDDLEKVTTYLTAHFGEEAPPTSPTAAPPPSSLTASMSNTAR